jgi:hypothetical protein
MSQGAFAAGKFTETALTLDPIHMGTRVYIPSIGTAYPNRVGTAINAIGTGCRLCQVQANTIHRIAQTAS